MDATEAWEKFRRENPDGDLIAAFFAGYLAGMQRGGENTIAIYDRLLTKASAEIVSDLSAIVAAKSS